MSRGVQVRVLFWALTAQVVKLVYTLLWGGSGRKIVWVRVSSCAHLLYGEKSETVFLLFLCGFLWDCSQEEYVCSWEKCVLSEKNRMRTVEEQYCDGRMWSGFDWNNHLLITYWLPTDHLLITYKNTEKICTDHTEKHGCRWTEIPWHSVKIRVRAKISVVSVKSVQNKSAHGSHGLDGCKWIRLRENPWDSVFE